MVVKTKISIGIDGLNGEIINRLNKLVKETEWEFGTIGMLNYFKKASNKYWFSWDIYMEDGETNSMKDDRLTIDTNLWIKED